MTFLLSVVDIKIEFTYLLLSEECMSLAKAAAASALVAPGRSAFRT